MLQANINRLQATACAEHSGAGCGTGTLDC